MIATVNAHTVTVANTGATVAVRIAKDGHNRGIAKLDAAGIDALIAALIAAKDAL